MCERGSWVFRRWIHVARHLLDNLTTTLPLSTLLPSPFYTVALRDDTRAETPRGFFFFSLLFFFLFFLYFSLYRQIRATEYEYIIRVTSGTRTMQLGKGGEERFVSFYPEELFEFSPRPIKIFTPISWRTLRSDGFREHDRHFRILDQILRSISCHVRGNWSNWLIYCRYGIA